MLSLEDVPRFSAQHDEETWVEVAHAHSSTGPYESTLATYIDWAYGVEDDGYDDGDLAHLRSYSWPHHMSGVRDAHPLWERRFWEKCVRNFSSPCRIRPIR